MFKKGMRVYCYPDVCYGTIQRVFNRRAWVEWDSMDNNGDWGAWYDFDEMRPIVKRRK